MRKGLPFFPNGRLGRDRIALLCVKGYHGASHPDSRCIKDREQQKALCTWGTHSECGSTPGLGDLKQTHDHWTIKTAHVLQKF